MHAMLTFEEALIAIGSEYAAAVAEHGGRSLARIATIVANQSTFFSRLENGATCTARNIEKFAAFFADPGNWPNGVVPVRASAALASMGRPVFEQAPLAAAG
jgi:hypothetical protein